MCAITYLNACTLSRISSARVTFYIQNCFIKGKAVIINLEENSVAGENVRVLFLLTTFYSVELDLYLIHNYLNRIFNKSIGITKKTLKNSKLILLLKLIGRNRDRGCS